MTQHPPRLCFAPGGRLAAWARVVLCGLAIHMLLYNAASAQQRGVWSDVAAGKGKLKKQAGKAGNAVQRWKKHLSEFGLDSSYRHAGFIGGRLNSNGYGGLVNYHRRGRPGRESIWQLSVCEVKHEQEAKQQRSQTAFAKLGAPSPFIFGKINCLYQAQLGYLRQQVLLPAVLQGNVSVGLQYGGGVALTMLKPYCLRLAYQDSSGQATLREEAYSDASREHFLNPGFILGAARWKTGTNRIHYIPGLFGEAAIVITPGRKKVFMQTVTLGVNGALFTDPLQIVADRKAYRWSGCLYASLAFGKGWK